MALSKFVNSSFPQCNVHTCVYGGCLAFTPLDGYLKLGELKFICVLSLCLTELHVDVRFFEMSFLQYYAFLFIKL